MPITYSPPSSATASCFEEGAASLPPNRISVPRPAIWVDTVTAPSEPASATIAASSASFFAFSTTHGTSAAASRFASLADEIVQMYAPEATAGGPPDDDGRLTDPTSQRFVDHAQRVAEGVHLEIHRNTWRYTRLIEHQRGVLLNHRNELLSTDLAATELAALCGERWEELAGILEEEVLGEAARQIMLYHTDRCWTEHLAFLSDVRETIHLRALARETPIDEFHRAAIPAFRKIQDEVGERSAETFNTAKITAEGFDLENAGLVRPSSTWTYMVHDNPFDTDAEQALQRVRAVLKKVRAARRH